MQIKLLGGALVTTLVLGTPTAKAAIVDITFTGLANGTDSTNSFGETNKRLTNAPYTAKYTFNTSIGDMSSGPDGTATYGGTYYGVPSPAVTSTITINGVTQVVNGEYIAEISAMGHEAYDQTADIVYLSGVDYSKNLVNDIRSASGGIPDGNQPFSYTVQPSDYNASFYEMAVSDASTGKVYSRTDLALSPETITETVQVGGIPEPSTWVMMTIGFAGLGIAAFRQTKRASVATA